jgi:hypothetical protein
MPTALAEAKQKLALNFGHGDLSSLEPADSDEVARAFRDDAAHGYRHDVAQGACLIGC